MNCTACGHESPPDHRFCEECGAPLAHRCAACGSDASPRAKFCGNCGTEIRSFVAEDAHASGPRTTNRLSAEARKVVTIVFADLIGSTSLHERLDAESVRRLMDDYYRALHGVIAAHGGTVVKLLGDGVMAAFGVPRVAEDDAIRAVRAAVEVIGAVRRLAVTRLGEEGGTPAANRLTANRLSIEDLSIRVGVNTGEVVVNGGNDDVVGDPVNVAARLQQEAGSGEVLIGEATRRLVGDLVTLEPFGELALKGRTETVSAYRVVSLERPAGAPALAFVGRESELRRVAAVYDDAVAVRAGRLAVVLGSPGLGKSRLVAEFSRRLGERATVISAHCEAAGRSTFAPLADSLRRFLGLEDAADPDAARAAIEPHLPPGAPERGRIAGGVAALIAGTPAPPEETYYVVRRFLAALAAVRPDAWPEASQGRPVVLVIDDLQWAEPLLLDLAEHLVQWTTDAPLMILAAARPELRDLRATLTSPGGVVSDVVTLAGLDAGAATRLAASAIGADELPAAVAGRVLAASEGNPLFVGELVRMLVDDGVLEREGDRWTTRVELAGLEMPPTIHALLAARIERLRAEDRIVLECAAVVGRHFSRAAVAHLLPPEITDLDARLESLRRGELIELDAGWFLGEPALRFHHVLIRDAAYRRLLKGTRAELHGRFADWAEAKAGKAVEYEEIVGWHLEQAHQLLAELGPLNDAGRAFGDRAAKYLAAAGRRALDRDDVALAANLLGRALDRLEPSDPARADLGLDLCEALLAAGDVGPAAKAVDELGRLGQALTPNRPTANRLSAWHTCFAGQLAVLTEPASLRETAAAVSAAADTLAGLNDATGEAKAHFVHAAALARLGEIGAGEGALDRALAAARRAGDRRRANAVLAGAPLAALWGPSPVTRASGRCLDVVRVLRITQGAPTVEAVALRCQAVLEALRGRTDAARRMIATSRQMVEELGIIQQVLECEVFSGLIELIEGDAVSAERCLRSAYDGLRRHGLAIDAARAAALLGRALLDQDRAADAEAASYESEALAGDDLKAASAWRGVRAQAVARRGRYEEAVDLARAAVGIAAATDALLDHADARWALGVALRAAGRDVEAGAEEARAFELWEAKGASLLAEKALRKSTRIAHRPGTLAPTRPPVQRNPAISAALRSCLDGFQGAIATRNLDALTPLIADDIDVVHYPSGLAYGRAEGLRRFELLFATENLTVSYEPLATLGDRLLLHRDFTSFTGFVDKDLEFGASRSSYLNVFEIDARGRAVRVEIFAEDRLGDAIVRLYECYAQGLGGDDGSGAAATARSIAAILGSFTVERYASALAADVEFVDHRIVGFPSGRGAGDLLRSVGSLLEIADYVGTRVDDVLALRPDAFLLRWTTFGVDRVSGGPFEWQFLRLCVFGRDGLLARAEQFDADRAEEAMARFAELVHAPPRTSALPAADRQGPSSDPFANAAARAVERFGRLWEARDWDALVASYAPGCVLDDRRSLVGVPIQGESFLANLRLMFDLPQSRWSNRLRATRGERLALFDNTLSSGGEGAGPVEFQHLSLVEIDGASLYAAVVVFDSEDLEAAYAELDGRFAASEGAVYPSAWENFQRLVRGVQTRDWSRLASALVPDLVAEDHRPLGWGTLRSRDEYVDRVRTLLDLRPDTIFRVDHLVAAADRAALAVVRWLGTEDSGSFDITGISVSALAADGRIRTWDFYNLDQLDEARARFAALGGAEGQEDPLRIPENAATRGHDGHARSDDQARVNAVGRTLASLAEAFRAQDWPAIRSLIRADFRFEDRRRAALVSGDSELWIKNLEVVRSWEGLRTNRELIATEGDRIALERIAYTGSAGGGPFEGDFLRLTEIDADGCLAGVIHFDVDALAEASAEARRRLHAQEPRGNAVSRNSASRLRDRITDAFMSKDWSGMRALACGDLVFEDRRKFSLLKGGVEEWIKSAEAVQSMSEVTFADDPIATLGDRIDVRRRLLRGSDPNGGAFESEFILLTEADAGGLLAASINFDVEAQAEALAEAHQRFAAADRV